MAEKVRQTSRDGEHRVLLKVEPRRNFIVNAVGSSKVKF
jgi:hypothetical protein